MKGTYIADLLLYPLMIHDVYYILNKLILLIHVSTAIFEQNDTHYKPDHETIFRTLLIPISFFTSHCITILVLS